MFDFIVGQTVSQLSFYLPQIFAAFLILLVGAAVAKFVKRLVVRLLEAINISKLIEKTPVEHFLKNADVKQKIESIIGRIMYWLLMLVVLQTTFSVLGLDPLSSILDRLLSYIPDVMAAIVVLFIGVLLAGVAESLVKGAIKSIDGKASRLLGKVTSYLVVSITVLAAISELGIANEFIMILFIGFVATTSLGLGLAFGLGGKDVVSKMLNEWYERVRKDVQE